MAITVTRETGTEEAIDFRNPEATLRYFVRATGADRYNEQAIRDAVGAACPAEYYGLTFASARIRELGGGVNEAECLYKLQDGQQMPGQLPGVGPGPGGPPPPTPSENETLDENFTFTTKGGTEKVTQSKKTLRRVKRGGGNAPNFKGAIGVTKDNKLDGVDRTFGKLEWSYTLKAYGVSLAYLKLLKDMTGTVNDAPFFFFEQGELLFMGASGQTKGPGSLSITYDFQAIANQSLVEIVPAVDPITGEATPGGSLILTSDADGPAKRGHDYLWVLYENGSDAGKLGSMPIAAYVEQIYDYTNFADLGIGGSQ